MRRWKEDGWERKGDSSCKDGCRLCDAQEMQSSACAKRLARRDECAGYVKNVDNYLKSRYNLHIYFSR